MLRFNAGLVAMEGLVTPVYSRSLARVFLVGGTDHTGALARDVLFMDLGAEVWQQVPPGGWLPGKVLAATYHAADGTLWILEEIAADAPRARLTRLDPETGKGELLGEWPRLHNFDRYWLRTDRDGALLVFASSDKTHTHAVLRLSAAAGALEALGFRVRAGALAHPPVVDGAGYWLMSEQGKKQLDVERLGELPLLPAGWLDQVGQCF